MVITDIFNILKSKKNVDFQVFRKLYFPTAKRVWGETATEGSDPSLSAISKPSIRWFGAFCKALSSRSLSLLASGATIMPEGINL